MIKRVFWVALFTGLSHLISLITVSYVIRVLGEETSGYLGVIDSTLMVVASVISFGIQLAVNRNVATQSSWKSNYKLAQSARLMLSLLVTGIGISWYIIQNDITVLIYVMAPLIALNGDYALYGNGKPIVASSLSFLRVALPNLGILIMFRFLGTEIILPYIVLLAIGILLAGIVASRFNQVDYLYIPRKDFAKFYYKYLKVGLYQVSSVLILTGVLVIANLFYEIAIIGLINGLLKILIIYKGGLRIIVQTFFKEIAKEGTALKIDKASMLVWGAIAIPVIIFSDTTLMLLFDDKYNDISYLLPFFGLIMFLAAFRNATEAEVLIQRKDNLNLYAFLSALVIEILLLIGFAYSDYPIWGIPIGILGTELILVVVLGIGSTSKDFFSQRFSFLLRFVPILGTVFMLRYVFDSNLYTMTGGLILYVVWAAFFNRSLIFRSVINER